MKNKYQGTLAAGHEVACSQMEMYFILLKYGKQSKPEWEREQKFS